MKRTNKLTVAVGFFSIFLSGYLFFNIFISNNLAGVLLYVFWSLFCLFFGFMSIIDYFTNYIGRPLSKIKPGKYLVVSCNALHAPGRAYFVLHRLDPRFKDEYLFYDLPFGLIFGSQDPHNINDCSDFDVYHHLEVNVEDGHCVYKLTKIQDEEDELLPGHEADYIDISASDSDQD
jgi:hypothetical protein